MPFRPLSLHVKTSVLPHTLFRVYSHSCRISGFFDSSKAQIADLADRAGKDLVDFYDKLAIKKISEAIMQVNDLMIAVYVVEKSIDHFDGKNITINTLVPVISREGNPLPHSRPQTSPTPSPPP